MATPAGMINFEDTEGIASVNGVALRLNEPGSI